MWWQLSSRVMNEDYDYDHGFTIIIHDQDIQLDKGYRGCYHILRDSFFVSYESTEWNNHIMVF